jgi:alpha-tubulin suppressor-like RCC1 family protein
MDSKLHAFGKASQGRLGLGNARRNQWVPAIVNLRLSRKSLAESSKTNEPQVKNKSISRMSLMRNKGRRGSSSSSAATSGGRGLTTQNSSEVGAVACGVACTVIVSFDEVWQTGTLRTQASSTSFCQVEELRGADFKRVACGSMHAMALSNSGHVYTWGQGSMLGHGDEVERPFPELVIGLVGHRITSISCSDFSSVAVSDDGVVFVWGQWWGSAKKKIDDVRILKVPTPIHVEDGSLKSSPHRSSSSHSSKSDSKDDKDDDTTVKVMDSLSDLELEETVKFADMVECGGSTVLIRTRQQQRV